MNRKLPVSVYPMCFLFIFTQVVQMQHRLFSITWYILPALPDNWHSGSVSGVRTRGGFVIEKLVWENGAIKELEIKSGLGGNCRIRCYLPLLAKDGKALKKASGTNKNPFFYVPEQISPLFSDKATITDYGTKTVFDYDVFTRKGVLYAFTAKK